MTETPSSLLGIEYQALIEDISIGGVPHKRSVGFSTTISKDCSQKEFDMLLDKCRMAVTRQRMFSEIEARTIDLRNLEESIGRGQQDLAEDNNRYSARADGHEGRAGRGLSSAEQKAMQDKVSNINNGLAMRNSLQERLILLKSMLDYHGETEKEILDKSRWDDNGGAAKQVDSSQTDLGMFPF